MDFLLVGLPQALADLGPGRIQLSLDWTCPLLGLWCLLSTTEWISQLHLFGDRGLLSWRVLSLRSHWLYQSPLLEPVYHHRGVAVMLALRLACAVAVIWPLQGWFRVAMLAAIVATGWLFKLRKWLSEDGSDQMGQVVATGTLLTALGLQWQDLLLSLAGTLLIAGQLTISYFLAGAAKLISLEWRSGRALIGIMGTEGFGHDFAARVASSSAWFSIAFCWLLILGETVFPAAVIGPGPVLEVFLAVFALFHVATALFMGLNTYVWAFLAAYPSVLLFNALIMAATNGA